MLTNYYVCPNSTGLISDFCQNIFFFFFKKKCLVDLSNSLVGINLILISLPPIKLLHNRLGNIAMALPTASS
jgi:hypothetical protein